MSNAKNNVFAALVAILVSAVSLQAIVTVPPADVGATPAPVSQLV